LNKSSEIICPVLLIWLLLTSCISLPPTRKSYINNYPGMDEKTKQLVIDKQIIVGMKSEYVLLAIGEPKEIEKFHGISGTYEHWSYKDRTIYIENGKIIKCKYRE